MDANLAFGRESVLARFSGEGGVGPKGRAFAPATEKYVIEGKVGSGGMREVMLATDRDLRRQVAMKVLRAEAGGDSESRLQFVAEAQATSQLEHPGIPPVHDIGIAPDGRYLRLDGFVVRLSPLIARTAGRVMGFRPDVPAGRVPPPQHALDSQQLFRLPLRQEPLTLSLLSDS